MIIVCTQDLAVRNNTNGTGPWGNLNLLSTGSQPSATTQMRGFVRGLGTDEALCFAAHGNNNEIGDPDRQGWVWSATDIANTLQQLLPAEYAAPILIFACATNVANFSANLAQALRDNNWRRGLWIYGYNLPVSTNASFPNPANLDANRSLQGTRV